MSYMYVNPQACTGCGECAENCPFDAIKIARAPSSGDMAAPPPNKAFIGPACRLCSTCEMLCPAEAIQFKSGSPSGDNHSPADTVRNAEDFHF